MDLNAFKLKYAHSGKPILAFAYEHAHRDILDYRAIIYKAKFSIFRAVEDDLRDVNIHPVAYANIVVRGLVPWIAKQGLSFVPVHTFLSKFGLDTYKRIATYTTVDLSNDDSQSIVLHDELMVARYYITSGAERLADAIQDIEPLLSDQWKIARQTKSRPVSAVLSLLADEFMLQRSSVHRYRDIMDSHYANIPE